jgi:DNA-binding PadR family transcriptional regulator
MQVDAHERPNVRPPLEGAGGKRWQASELTPSAIYSTLKSNVMTRSFHGEFEQLVLLAILRLGADAHGTPIRHEIEDRTGRSVTVGALYSALDRLERKGFLRAEVGDPTPQRGGRARRHYEVLPAGLVELRRARRALDRMWDGLEPERR